MKASDIADHDILAVVAASVKERGMWSNTTLVAEQFPELPFKVVAAKLAKVYKRGLVSGCPCGCRGDWELTAKGKATLSQKSDR